MFRLSKNDEDGATVLTVDGDISDECVEALEDLCRQAASQRRPVRLHLRDVITVNGAGWRMLRRLVEQGVSIRAGGLYISYAIGALRKTAQSGPPLVNPR